MTDNRRITVGVVGAGRAAALHLQALAKVDGADVLAVADVDPAAAAATAERFGVPRIAASLDELLSLGVEAIHNCTSNRSHAAVNEAALATRRHVLAEKPLAISSTESRRLVELEHAARAEGVVAAVCFTRRHLPAVKRIRSAVEGGAYGPVHLVRAGYAQDWLLDEADWDWRLDPTIAGPSAAVADIGSHALDLAEHVAGSRVAELVADLGTLHPTRSGGTRRVTSEDHAAVLGILESGARVSVLLSQVSAGHRDQLTLDISLRDVAFAWEYERPTVVRVGRRGAGFREELEPDGDGQAFTHTIRDFYDAVRSGRPDTVPLATFADGHHSVCLVEAVLRSHDTRSWTRVEDT
jgi:predicted dehydrogenase